MSQEPTHPTAQAELNPTQVLVVYCTCPTVAAAEQLARSIVEARVAACVSVLPGLTSVYRWDGDICTDAECLLMVKTKQSTYPALETLIRAQHPYEVPEILAVPAAAGHHEYLQWVHAQCAPPGIEQ